MFVKILEGSVDAVSVLAGGVCADARACASVDRRTRARDTIEGRAGFEATRVSRAMRQRKRRNLTPQLQLPFPREQSGPVRFWQRRFYDFNVYSRSGVFDAGWGMTRSHLDDGKGIGATTGDSVRRLVNRSLTPFDTN